MQKKFLINSVKLNRSCVIVCVNKSSASEEDICDNNKCGVLNENRYRVEQQLASLSVVSAIHCTVLNYYPRVQGNP